MGAAISSTMDGTPSTFVLMSVRRKYLAVRGSRRCSSPTGSGSRGCEQRGWRELHALGTICGGQMGLDLCSSGNGSPQFGIPVTVLTRCQVLQCRLRHIFSIAEYNPFLPHSIVRHCLPVWEEFLVADGSTAGVHASLDRPSAGLVQSP
jgi:hypothetical protein